MLVVAGPPGSGKSRLFPIQRSGLDWFSVDDCCAELNGGSYQGIPPAVRARASRECEAFIRAHIEAGRSFAVQSTLRTLVAVEQARAARAQGSTLMTFAATDDVEANVKVTARGVGGGHSAPPERVREVYRSSRVNLPGCGRGVRPRAGLRQQPGPRLPPPRRHVPRRPPGEPGGRRAALAHAGARRSRAARLRRAMRVLERDVLQRAAEALRLAARELLRQRDGASEALGGSQSFDLRSLARLEAPQEAHVLALQLQSGAPLG